MLGDLGIELPGRSRSRLRRRHLALIAIVPVSIGAGLIRPALNSLITKRVSAGEYGRVLGFSAALVSAANASAPLLAGLDLSAGGLERALRNRGLLMAGLCLSVIALKPRGERRIVRASALTSRGWRSQYFNAVTAEDQCRYCMSAEARSRTAIPLDKQCGISHRTIM